MEKFWKSSSFLSVYLNFVRDIVFSHFVCVLLLNLGWVMLSLNSWVNVFSTQYQDFKVFWWPFAYYLTLTKQSKTIERKPTDCLEPVFNKHKHLWFIFFESKRTKLFSLSSVRNHKRMSKERKLLKMSVVSNAEKTLFVLKKMN